MHYNETMIKVLIAEDNVEIRSAYAFAFSHHGFEVDEAGDGAEAMRKLERGHPAVILLDMLMPGTSGLDFLRQARIKERYPDVQVIAFSNIETPRVVEQAGKLGCSKYVLKVDVTPPQMVELVRDLVPSH